MTLSVLGLGLRTPAGTNAREHVFFLPAGAPPPAPSAFVKADGSPLWVGHAKFVSTTQIVERLTSLGLGALEEAKPAPSLPLIVCLPQPREGLSAKALEAISIRIAEAARASSLERVAGAAGVFSALALLGERLAAGSSRAATLVAVDSFFHEEAAVTFVTRPPSPFDRAPLPLAEGAAALFVADNAVATHFGRESLGEILAGAAALGRGTDDDDEPTDAAALTGLLQGLPVSPPIRSVFGQGQTDPLRARDWAWAAARAAARFHPEAFGACLEAEIGRIGAAAGLASLVHALASLRHGALPPRSHFVAWAISRDGTRGLALGVGPEKISNGAQTPLTQKVVARRFEREVRSDTPFSRPRDEALTEGEASFDPDALLAPANDIAPPLPPLPEALAEAPAARLDPARLRPASMEDFRAEVVAHCVETLSMLGKSRALGPRRAAREVERRMVCQVDAVVAAGPSALAFVAAFWADDVEDPWRSFGATIAALAFDGPDASGLVAEALSSVPEDALGHARLVAEALGLCERADLFELGRSLLSSGHAPARAAGLLFLAERGALPAGELRGFFLDERAVVRAAALEACQWLPASSFRELAPTLRELSAADPGEPGARAARLLAIHGDPAVRRALAEGSLVSRLGPRAAELFVLLAGAEEAAAAEAFFTRQTPTPALLSAAARWGRPAVLPRLLSCLAGDDLAEPAAAALASMLGPLATPKDPFDAGAWRRKIETMRLDGAARYRLGLPYSTAVVADECAGGELSREALALRIDELRARLGRPDPVSLTSWFSESESSVAPLLAAARKGKG